MPKSTKKPIKRKTSKKRLIELCEQKIFEELKEERGARCEICGGNRQLGLFHVLPKGVYYNIRLHKENLLIAGWFCCHLPFHHDYYVARDRIVPRIKELLGEDYEERLKRLADTAEKLTEVRLLEILEGSDMGTYQFCECKNPIKEIGVYCYKGNFDHYIKNVCNVCHKPFRTSSVEVTRKKR